MTAKGTLIVGATQRESFNVPYNPDGLKKPIIAIRPRNGYAALYSANKNNVSMTTACSIVGDVGAIVDWYCFDVPSAISTAGIKIFDSIGKVVFDSGNKYARVTEYWEPGTVSAWNGVTKTYPDDRLQGVASLSGWYRKNATSSTKDCGGSKQKYKLFYESQMCQVTSGLNSFTFARRTWRTDETFGECTANDPRNGGTKSNLVILDVTGY